MKPLISVYILNHNYGKYLDCSIESVLQQTYKNIEIIVIDDCSSDISDKVIKKREADNRIKIIKNTSQKGLIISANIALKASKGEYVIRLDADDFFEKEAVDLLYNDYINAYQLNKNIVGIFGNYNEIDKNANLIRTVHKTKINNSVNEIDIPIHGACTLIKKDWLVEHDGYDESFTRQDGYYLWALAAATGKFFSHSEGIIFNYRQHSQSLSFNRSKILLERSRISEKIVQKMKINKTINIVVPIRADDIDDDLVLMENFLENSIIPLLQLNFLNKIILVSASVNVQEYVKKCDNKKLVFFNRNLSLEHKLSNIRDTLIDLAESSFISEISADIVMVRTLANKDLPLHIINQLFAYLTIFSRKDVAILVRQVKGHTYKNLATSLQKFSLQEKHHYERDVLYERVDGGFAIESSKFHEFINHRPLRIGIIEVE
jgi:glycosyltransferase involved in cell wall biosynthesis